MENGRIESERCYMSSVIRLVGKTEKDSKVGQCMDDDIMWAFFSLRYFLKKLRNVIASWGRWFTQLHN